MPLTEVYNRISNIIIMVSILEIKLIFYISQIASSISESNLTGGGVSTVLYEPISSLVISISSETQPQF